MTRPGQLFAAFEETARRHPGGTAVVAGEERLSYAGLLEAALALSGRLRQDGVRPGDPVGLFFVPGASYPAALLGAAAAGAVFVPLDPTHPPARLRRLVELARPAAVVRGPGLESLWSEVAADHLPGPPLHPEACYVLFTSGSTGTPKAVLGSHAGLLDFLGWEIETLGLGRGTRSALLAPLGFDVSLRDLLAPLLAGGEAYVPPPGLLESPAVFWEWLGHSRIDLLHVVPSVMRLLLQELRESPPLSAHASSLRAVLFAGEPLHGRDVRAFRELTGGGARLFNLYGPSETTLARFCHPVGPLGSSADDGAPVAVGKPLPGTHLHLLGEGGEPVPAGESGEVVLATPYPLLGYFRDPERTARQFVPDPAGPPGARLYRTGDRGRLDVAGDLHLSGRLDDQLKILGNRVEPGEVERALLSHPDLGQAHVVAWSDGAGTPQLAGFVLAREAPAESELRAHLARQLPPYLLPAALLAVEAFPLTAHGKVDRARLRELAAAAPGSGGEPPRPGLETELAALWQETLGAPVSRSTSFFQAGGNSLKGIRLINRVFKTLGARQTLPELFAHPTLAAQARLLAGRLSRPAPPIGRAPGDGPFLLTHAQHRLWMLDRIWDSRAAYNVPFSFWLHPAAREDALEQALLALIDRHEPLRTRFPHLDGRPVQVVVPPEAVGFRLEVQDETGHPDPERRAAELAEDEASRPFDLERGPLLRARLLRLAAGRRLLLLSFHHIAVDYWSLAILRQEIAALYPAAAEGRQAALPPLAVRFRDAVVWYLEQLDGPAMARLRAHWLARFAPLPPRLDLTPDRPRPKVLSYRGAKTERRLPPELAAAVEKAARERGMSTFLFLLSTVAALLHRYTGGDDLVLGTPVAGRPHPDLEPLVGFFVNTLPLRLSVPPGASFAALAESVRRSVLEDFGHDAYPFDKLVEDLALARDFSRSPLFDVFVVVVPSRGFGEEIGAIEGLFTRPAYEDRAHSKFDLSFYFFVSDPGLSLSVEYNSELFGAARIEALLRHYTTLLARLLEAPDRPLADHDYLDVRQSRKLLALCREPLAPTVAAELRRELPPGIAPEGELLAWVLDPRLRLVPAGVKGQIFLADDGGGTIENPFQPGERLVPTGLEGWRGVAGELRWHERRQEEALPFTTPRNATEERLAEIWREVLGVDQVSVHQDFFQANGSSLKALQLAAAIHRAFGIELPLPALSRRSSIEGQARLLAEAL